MNDTATAIASDVRSRRRSAIDAVEAALDRAADDRCNAIVTLCAAEARREAAAIDHAIGEGRDPGLLAGVPFTVKDTIAAAGLRTTAGSRLFEHNVTEQDAACVARLRRAGAILVGKTNCPEFALQAHTDNLVFGATSHPDAPGMSPGGSSGGCAAAVGAGIVPLSIGGDYGGSVRYPASCTGVYGFRPGRGTVAANGTVPDPPPGTPRHAFQTVGPLARTIDDIALADSVLRELAGADAVNANVRVGVVRGGWPVDEFGRDALERVVLSAESAGYQVSATEADPFVRATDLFDAWRATDRYDDLRALAAGREGALTPHIAGLISRGASADRAGLTPIAAEARALERIVAGLLELTPVIVLPVALVGVLALGATHVQIAGQTESIETLRILAPSRAISLLGLPALAVPAGVDSRGLPVGVQLVGRLGDEDALFSVARALATTRRPMTR